MAYIVGGEQSGDFVVVLHGARTYQNESETG